MINRDSSEPKMAPPPGIHEDFVAFCERHELDLSSGVERLANLLFDDRYNDFSHIHGTVSDLLRA